MLNYKEGIYFRHKSTRLLVTEAFKIMVKPTGDGYSLCIVIREVKSTYVVIHVCVHRFAYNITREF